MGQLQILIFQILTHQTLKRSSEGLVNYLYLAINFGMIGHTKQLINAQ